MVCEYLPQSDLASFRLTRSCNAAMGGKALCRTLHVMFTSKSLQNLQNLARHPTLSKYVAGLTYEALYLDHVDLDVICHRVHRKCWDFHLEYGYNKKATSAVRKVATKVWEAYEPMLNAQEDMKQTDDFIVTFAQALCLFPNLGSIEISTPKSPTTSMSYSLRHTQARRLGLVVKGQNSHRLPGNKILNTDSALNMMLMSIRLAPKLLRLKSSAVNLQMFDPSPAILSTYTSAFSQLRHLDLRFSSLCSDPHDRASAARLQKTLGALICAARELEYLSLIMDGDTMNTSELSQDLRILIDIQVHEVFGECNWPKLHTLKISNMTTDDSALPSFLRRHASSLKVVEMGNMRLDHTEHNWHIVFQLMATEMNLSAVGIYGSWDVNGQEGHQIYHFEPDSATVCDAILNKELGLLGPPERPKKRRALDLMQ